MFDRDSHSEPIWSRSEMLLGLQWKSRIKVFEAVSKGSSSRVRELLKEYYQQGTGLEELQKMVPDKVLESILANKFYCD